MHCRDRAGTHPFNAALKSAASLNFSRTCCRIFGTSEPPSSSSASRVERCAFSSALNAPSSVVALFITSQKKVQSLLLNSTPVLTMIMRPPSRGRQRALIVSFKSPYLLLSPDDVRTSSVAIHVQNAQNASTKSLFDAHPFRRPLLFFRPLLKKQKQHLKCGVFRAS